MDGKNVIAGAVARASRFRFADSVRTMPYAMSRVTIPKILSKSRWSAQRFPVERRANRFSDRTVCATWALHSDAAA